MSEHNTTSGTPSDEVVGKILMGLGLIAFIVVLIVFATLLTPKHNTAAKDAAVAENIKPVAEVVVASADAAATGGAAKSADEIVSTTCNACHGMGVLGAPKIGDNAAWGPRIAQGYDTLVKNAVNGIRAMPAKGGNTALSDAEVASAVALMANKSGASFK
jgi:cytochrome c5